MSVLSIEELHQNRRSSWTGGQNRGTVKHARAWLVTCDNATDGTAKALGAVTLSLAGMDEADLADLDDEEFRTLVNEWRARIPIGGDSYPNSFMCRLTSLSAEPVKDSDRVFLVTAEYESVDNEFGALHPLSRPASFSYSANEVSCSYFLDESSPKRPMANSAGDPFENSSEREEASLVITMNRNEATFSPVAAVEIANTTNAQPVTLDGTTYAKDTLKLSMPTATKQSEMYGGVGVDFYAVTRTFKARRDTHVDRLLDLGYNEIALVPGPSGTPIYDRVPIVDPAGSKISRPWPLDGAGHAIPSPSGAPAVLERRPYRSVSWATMSLE